MRKLRPRVRALKLAREIRKRLTKELGRSVQVIMFGSQARGDATKESDIDLLVKALEDEEYFEILADISNLSHPFRVDLIPYQNAWPSVKKRVLKEGVRLD